jgi:hypothetical protein
MYPSPSARSTSVQTSRDGVTTHRDPAALECIELPRRQRVALVLGMVLSAHRAPAAPT